MNPLVVATQPTGAFPTPLIWTPNTALGSSAAAGNDVRWGPRNQVPGLVGVPQQAGDPGALVYHYGAGGSALDWQGFTSSQLFAGYGAGEPNQGAN